MNRYNRTSVHFVNIKIFNVAQTITSCKGVAICLHKYNCTIYRAYSMHVTIYRLEKSKKKGEKSSGFERKMKLESIK